MTAEAAEKSGEYRQAKITKLTITWEKVEQDMAGFIDTEQARDSVRTKKALPPVVHPWCGAARGIALQYAALFLTYRTH